MPSDQPSLAQLIVHGAQAPAAWWRTLLDSLPPGVAVASTAAPPVGVDTVETPALPADAGRTQCLAWGAANRPGVPLVLVAAGAVLPPWWCERLLAALDAPDVLAAGPLDALDGRRSPLPAATTASAERIDALCYAYGRRVLVAADDVSPLASAWHGARLQQVDIATVAQGDAFGAMAPHRCVLLDHLYVGAPGGRAPRAANAASPALGELRARLAAALADEACVPALDGHDPRPVVLHVLHGWGGGAERFVRDLAAADTTHIHRVLVARGDFTRRRYGESLELLDGSFAGPPLRQAALPRPIADTAIADHDWRAFFDAVLREQSVRAVVVSSLIGHSLDALASGLPTLAVIHDCYPLWPILHRDFGDASLAFDDAQRSADLAAADAEFEFGSRAPAHWRALRDAYVRGMLAARAQLAAPSASALANVLRLAPELAALPSAIVPHGIAPWSPAAEIARLQGGKRARLRLVVPGRVRRGKGAELLRAALPALREHAEIFLLGGGAEAMSFFGERDVHVLLDYRREELPALVASLAPDAALLLPTVAETFSYTLSECLSLGLPVIATRVGALAERIRDGVDGFLVAPDAASVATRVAGLAQSRDRLDAVRATLATLPVRDLDTMAADYRRLLPAQTHGAEAHVPHAASGADLQAQALAGELSAARARIDALARTAREQLAELDARAEWAIGLDRDLKRREAEIGYLQADLRTLQNDYEERGRWLKKLLQIEEEFAERTRWALALKSELDLAYGSLSWRLTRPLRVAKRTAQGLRARLAFYRSRIVNGWRRTRSSIDRRGYAGTLRRAWKELQRTKVPAVAVAGAPAFDDEPFAVPTSDTPRVSIVIPVYNKIDYTVACLRSLAGHAGSVTFETIVVDDCSTDATPERLQEIAGVRSLRNAQNLGFVGSCNAGAAAARGEFVLFLNNDTVVTPGWLEALVQCFADEPDAGLVGAKLVYPDGRLQEAGGIVFKDGSGWNFGRFDDPAEPHYNFRREADYCSGAAIMLRRELFGRLGGFDARYAPAYYEDTDLAFAVRKAGLKVYYEPRSTVIHFEGISAGTDTGSGMKRYQVVNREKFLEKWKDELARQPAPIDDPALAPRAATFRATKRVLIVDACTPTPDQDSGSLRMVNLMRLMRALGWQVTFFAENRLYLDRYTPALQALGVEVLYTPYLQDAVKLFRRRGESFDAILLSRHYIAINYLGLARLYAPRATLIFDTVDLHYLRERRAAELENSAELKRRAEVTRAQELKLIRECDVTLVVSPVERDLLAQELPQARVEILSNVHEVFGCRRAFGERQDLVFVGSFQHPPNEDAVLWFARDVFPAVRQALPGVRFHVIGQPPPPAVLALAADDLVVHGFVEDLEPFMDGCRISVAPLRYGAGVKGKVNMAMSYGLPVVATPAAVEGMHVAAGKDVLVAPDAAGFAAAVARLYGDEALWKTLSANGLANVERHFSFDAAKKALARIVK